MFDLMDAAALKNVLKARLDIDLHIHDTCGDFFMSLDTPNDTAFVFINAYAKAENLTVKWNDARTAFSIHG